MDKTTDGVPIYRGQRTKRGGTLGFGGVYGGIPSPGPDGGDQEGRNDYDYGAYDYHGGDGGQEEEGGQAHQGGGGGFRGGEGE